MNVLKLMFLFGIIICFISCKNGPKVISTAASTDASPNQESTGIFSDAGEFPAAPVSEDVHTVKVLEVLPTSKYIYLRVDEKGEEFWIATGKKDVKEGETYFYKNGILKTNFESKEYNRVFDKVYLVANIVPANHGMEQNPIQLNTNEKPEKQPQKNIIVEGSTKISELVNNKQKYEGQEIQISGVCTKLNPNIMGRNWVHLKDGSMDEYDLVITSEHAVPEGHTVTMKGTVVLDKDFGAGYKYDLIIENGQIVLSK